jgi:hypothetical protein
VFFVENLKSQKQKQVVRCSPPFSAPCVSERGEFKSATQKFLQKNRGGSPKPFVSLYFFLRVFLAFLVSWQGEFENAISKY